MTSKSSQRQRNPLRQGAMLQPRTGIVTSMTSSTNSMAQALWSHPPPLHRHLRVLQPRPLPQRPTRPLKMRPELSPTPNLYLWKEQVRIHRLPGSLTSLLGGSVDYRRGVGLPKLGPGLLRGDLVYLLMVRIPISHPCQNMLIQLDIYHCKGVPELQKKTGGRFFSN